MTNLLIGEMIKGEHAKHCARFYGELYSSSKASVTLLMQLCECSREEAEKIVLDVQETAKVASLKMATEIDPIIDKIVEGES